jgi:hypothetical protein
MFSRLAIVGSIIFTVIAPQELTTPEKNAIAAVQSVKQKIAGCPASEEVALFRGKWVKVSWGPPQNLQFDVEKTASLVAPYKGTITFSIPYSNGQMWKTQEEANKDKDLKILFSSPVQYTFQVATNSIVKLETMQIKNSLEDKWGPYNPVHPERFCWITTAK